MEFAPDPFGKRDRDRFQQSAVPRPADNDAEKSVDLTVERRLTAPRKGGTCRLRTSADPLARRIRRPERLLHPDIGRLIDRDTRPAERVEPGVPELPIAIVEP